MAKESRRSTIEALILEIRRQQTAVDRLDDEAVARLGLSRSEGRCLDIVEQRGRVTSGDLATASGLTPGAITALVDRLERAGMLRRVRDGEDRRQVLVELTPTAARHARDLYGPLAAWAAADLDRYSDAELALLRDFFRRGRTFVEAYATHLQAGTPPATAARAAARPRRRKSRARTS